MEQTPNRDVYIFFGPDFAGKHTFYKRELTNTYVCVRPSYIYQRNPTYGFRDVCFQIVSLLKEGWSVAIVDKNECKKTRMSYVKLLRKKCGEISFGAISILPKYGCDQLFWTRELRLAEESCKYTDNPTSNIHVCDSQIQKWFTGESNLDVSYQPGIVEALSENEGFKVLKKVVGIYTRSVYKFEVPALFVQWELFSKYSSSPGLLKTCLLWADANTSGRIIVLCDGYQILTGETKRNQELKLIDEAIKVFINKFTSSPVYVFHVSEPKIAESYINPPKPGILAFLQQRHCLNLHSKRTLYVYESTVHMKMAEAASVRHIKGSRLMEHPELVLSSHAASTPAIQEMLQSMKLLSQKSEDNVASIPLFDKNMSYEGRLHQQFAHGRCEYLYSHDKPILERYNDLYKELATKVGDPGSKFSPKSPVHSSSSLCRGTGSVSVNVSGKSSVDSSSRDLPKWMIKRDSKKTPASLERSVSSDSSVGAQIRNTVYVMTDKELLEVACEVLKQGGKTELVENFLHKKNDETDCESKSELRTDTTTNKDNLQNVTRIKGDKRANICPKLDNKSENCDIISAMTEESSSSDISDVSDLDSMHEHKVVEDNCKLKMEDLSNVENIVADVLDEFSASDIAPKPSPRKRARVDRKEMHLKKSPHKRQIVHSNKIDTKDHSVLLPRKSVSGGHQDKTLSRKHTKKQRTHQYEYSPDMSHLEDIFS